MGQVLVFPPFGSQRSKPNPPASIWHFLDRCMHTTDLCGDGKPAILVG